MKYVSNFGWMGFKLLSFHQSWPTNILNLFASHVLEINLACLGLGLSFWAKNLDLARFSWFNFENQLDSAQLALWSKQWTYFDEIHKMSIFFANRLNYNPKDINKMCFLHKKLDSLSSCGENYQKLLNFGNSKFGVWPGFESKILAQLAFAKIKLCLAQLRYCLHFL